MTRELRERIAKGMTSHAENSKADVREIRNSFMKSISVAVKDLNLRKQADMSMQKLYGEANKTIDALVQTKQHEILTKT
jgi:ribosome recycling factor